MRCKNELQLEYIFFEVNQAICKKVLQVLFNQTARDPGFCSKLIVRMDGLHMVLCLYRNNIQSFLGLRDTRNAC